MPRQEDGAPINECRSSDKREFGFLHLRALRTGSRALSIAGGTSEIKRNQIGERILGLPRDPLIN